MLLNSPDLICFLSLYRAKVESKSERFKKLLNTVTILKALFQIKLQ